MLAEVGIHDDERWRLPSPPEQESAGEPTRQ
jgi:hypothetical protein